jgi:hypothetical protein
MATFIRHQDFEHYVDGAAVTITNGSSGTSQNFDTVNLGAGTISVSGTSPLIGTRSAVITGGTATTYVGWNVPAGTTRLAIGCAFNFAAFPTTTYTLMEIRSASAQIASLAMSNTGFFVMQSAGVTITGSSTSGTYTYPVGVTKRAEIYATLESGVGAADGTVGLRIYAADGTTVEKEITLTGKSTGTAAFASSRYATPKATGAGYTVQKLDEALMSDPVSPAWMGLYVAAPTANAGPDQLEREPFATITLDGSASTTPSGTLSYAWTQTSGPAVTLNNATTVSPNFVAAPSPTTQTYVFSLVVTANAVASAADTVTVTVAPHTWWEINAGPVIGKALKLPL